MTPPDAVKSRRITIECMLGHDPDNFDTYAWKVTCEPTLPDELVAGILGEVLKVY